MPREDKSKELLEVLIREAIETALVESVSDSTVYKAFIEPFTDVFKTAQHSVEKIMATTISELGTLAKGVAFTLIPFIKPDAGSIGAMARQDRERLLGKLGTIDSKFQDVIQRNWHAFNNPDMMTALFLMHPQVFIGGKLALQAPELALQVLSSLTGGNQTVERILKGYQEMRAGPGGRAAQAWGSTSSWDTSMSGPGGYSDYADYGMVEEQQQTQQAQPPQAPPPQQKQPPPAQQQARPKQDPKTWAVAQIKTLLANPQIRQQIAKSPVTKTMQTEAVNQIVNAAKKFLGGLTMQTVKTKAGQKYHEAVEQFKQKLPEEEQKKDFENDPKFQQAVLKNIKDAMKPAFIAQLQSLIKANPTATGVVNKGIQQIQQM